MKKRTLNQTWTLCLQMWRWIAKVWQTPRYRRYSIHELKEIWLRKNKFIPNRISNSCFFCDYTPRFSCNICPGRLVVLDFHCCNKDYNWEIKPVEFYKELLRLNRIRKAKNE